MSIISPVPQDRVYCIGILGSVVTEDTHSGRSLDLTHRLEQADYERYLDAVAELRRVVDRCQFQLIDRNYRRLTSIARFYAKVLAAGQRNAAVRSHDVMLSIASDTVNWLTSTRRCQPVEAIELVRRSAKTSAGVR